MKTAILAVIAFVGLLVLGGLGWLAFARIQAPQQAFTQDYTPPASIPEKPAAAAPAAMPTPPAPEDKTAIPFTPNSAMTE